MMESKIEELSSVKRRAHIKVKGAELRQEFEKQLARLQTRASIKGFRPGKAPLAMVRREFQEELHRQTLNAVTQESVNQLLKEQSLRLVDYPVLDKREVVADGDLELTLSLEVKPDLQLRNYSGLTLERPTVEVTEAEIVNVIEQLRERYTTSKQKEEEKDAKPPELDELDDALAQSISNFKTLTELKTKIGEDLRLEKVKRVQQQVEQQALVQILDANPFEVPPTLVRHRQEHLLEQFARAGVRVKDEEEFKKLQEELLKQALYEVRVDLVLEAIATAEKIAVMAEEIDARIDTMIGENNPRAQEFRTTLNREENREQLVLQMKRLKTLAFIIDKATIREGAIKK